MALQVKNGDYVPNGAGGFVAVSGGQALLDRVLFRLTARRGAFPLLPEFGSRLYLLPRKKPSARQALAASYAAEALADETDLKITKTVWEEDRAALTVYFSWNGQALDVAVSLDGEGESQ